MASVTEAASWSMTAEPEGQDVGNVVVRTYQEFAQLLDQSGAGKPVKVKYIELVKHARDYEMQPRQGPLMSMVFPELQVYPNGGDYHFPFHQVKACVAKKIAEKGERIDPELEVRAFAVYKPNKVKTRDYMSGVEAMVQQALAPKN